MLLEAGPGLETDRLARKTQISKLILSGRIRSATIAVSSINEEKLAMKGTDLIASASHGAVNSGFVRWNKMAAGEAPEANCSGKDSHLPAVDRRSFEKGSNFGCAGSKTPPGLLMLPTRELRKLIARIESGASVTPSVVPPPIARPRARANSRATFLILSADMPVCCEVSSGEKSSSGCCKNDGGAAPETSDSPIMT